MPPICMGVATSLPLIPYCHVTSEHMLSEPSANILGNPQENHALVGIDHTPFLTLEEIPTKFRVSFWLSSNLQADATLDSICF